MNRKQRRAAEKSARRYPFKTQRTGERKVMSLARIEADILAAQEEGKAAIAKYNDYAKSVTEEVHNLLRQAGLFDAINALEMDRLEVRKELQAKIEGVNAKISELQKVRSYLAAPAPEAPAPAAPAHEEVSEDAHEDAPEVTLVEEPAAEKKTRKKKTAPAPEAPAPVVARKLERPQF
jgi:hypothetical protein